MKKQKARGQVRRFLRRSIACLLAIVGMGMAAVTAGLPQPLGWLGGLGGIQTAMAAQAPAGDGPVPFWQRLLLGDSALLAQWAAESAGQAQGEKPEETAPEEAEEEQNLQAVTPDKIQEKTISGSGSGYVMPRASPCSTGQRRRWIWRRWPREGLPSPFKRRRQAPKS